MNLKYLALTVLLAACKTGSSDSADTDVADTDVQETVDTDVETLTCDDPTLANACDECIGCAQSEGGECFDALATCNANAECGALLACTNACADSNCIQLCAADHPDGVADLQAVAGCLQSTCVESCPQG